jgi:hypothetical protein
MIILTFTKEETDQISAESPIFLAKVNKIVKPSTLPQAPRPIDIEAGEYLDTIFTKHGMATCVQKVREWAKDKGIQKYASLAGAKRLVESRMRH